LIYCLLQGTPIRCGGVTEMVLCPAWHKLKGYSLGQLGEFWLSDRIEMYFMYRSVLMYVTVHVDF
jgi:hypothetical protein